jgi:AcrR family transcriptional regulator
MTPPTEPSRSTRGAHSSRQESTVDALVDAAARVLDEVGYDALTLRRVAVEAGVTHTTAYTYFSSKAHLVAEMFARRLGAVPVLHAPHGADTAERIRVALGGPAVVLGADPALASAALSALLGNDPDVVRLRTSVGAELARRLTTALGDTVDPPVVELVLLAFSGAMLQAGMGYLAYDEVVDRITTPLTRVCASSQSRTRL